MKVRTKLTKIRSVEIINPTLMSFTDETIVEKVLKFYVEYNMKV